VCHVVATMMLLLGMYASHAPAIGNNEETENNNHFLAETRRTKQTNLLQSYENIYYLPSKH
jgi:hypothetical protein